MLRTGNMFRTRNIMWRITVWCIVSWHALVISGLPLPVDAMTSQLRLSSGTASKKLAAKDCTTPFPCMNKPCGCMSAKQCFQKCCCHTPDETLAWAQRHGVSEDVLHALQRRVKEHDASSGSDFQQHVQQTCCKVKTSEPSAVGLTASQETSALNMFDEEVCFEYEYLSAAGEQECCAENQSQHDQPSGNRCITRLEVMSEHTVILQSLLTCGGILSEWLASGVAIPLVPVVAVCCGQLYLELPNQSHNVFHGERPAPLTPPPCMG